MKKENDDLITMNENGRRVVLSPGRRPHLLLDDIVFALSIPEPGAIERNFINVPTVISIDMDAGILSDGSSQWQIRDYEIRTESRVKGKRHFTVRTPGSKKRGKAELGVKIW